MMTIDYVLSMQDEDGERRYPSDKPFTLREQSLRPWDETIKVVLLDIADVLMSNTEYASLLDKATALVSEAESLNEDDENYSESLNDILQEAEQLDHVCVEWDGDAGTVSVSITDYWYEVEDAS
jgi:hypothetical protein